MDKFILCAAAIVLLSCSKGENPVADMSGRGDGGLSHDMIVLGERLENPYKTDNVREAYEALYPTKSRDDITTTDLYVRFLPKNEDEYETLLSLGMELIDHPVDYAIVKEGDYYHDPSVSEEEYTWQYAIVAEDFDFPDIKYEIIDECFIAENSPSVKSDDGIDWEAVEQKAYSITGNEDMLSPALKGKKSNPSGRVTIVDDKANGGKPFGIAGVRVMCNTFVKFSSAYTDRDGYYKIPKSYSSKVRYRLVFKNEKNFGIGMNLIIVPASMSAMGTASPEGMDLTITKDSDRKLFCRSAVNNAVYDYYSRCGEEDMDILAPPSDLRLWILNGSSSSSCPMIHHGAVVDRDYYKQYLAIFAKILQFFSPDITVGTSDDDDYQAIYDKTCHELAHASHFRQVGLDYWNKYIGHIVKSYVMNGGLVYGNGDEDNAGLCEIGEMWAYYLETMMHMDRYGDNIPTYGTGYWFYPQIFRYLEERGISRNEIFSSLQEDINNRSLLKAQLKSICPSKSKIIEDAFNRYK